MLKRNSIYAEKSSICSSTQNPISTKLLLCSSKLPSVALIKAMQQLPRPRMIKLFCSQRKALIDAVPKQDALLIIEVFNCYNAGIVLSRCTWKHTVLKRCLLSC